LEPTFYFMVAQDPKDYTGWETRYVLLIWLSLICMVPFDLKTVDSLAAAEEDKFPLVDHMVELSKFYLKVTGKERDDIAELYLANYIKWAQDEVRNEKDVFTITGILTSLCAIYKLGQRQTLLPTLESVLPCLNLLEGNQLFVNNTLIRKLLVKLAQRIGLCYLKPKVASWRYQRGSRSLKDNLDALSKTTTIDPSNVHQSLEDEKDEDEEVPEQLEEIIEILLNGLRSKDTVVRWSAAKGIGRIAQRLPRELADDVIGSLFELFSENTYKNNDGVLELSAVSDHTWHGVCLAIAELARRGLLLPERLSEVIPWVTKALKFDQKRGSHSIGAHVRDAACYVCWSFARAYAPEIIEPYVVELSNNLVVVSVFDREVNVRRASSAAFQENVGHFGSEVTAQAAVSHIASLAKAGWPVTDEVLKKWKSVVYDLLSRKDEIGQEIAVHAVEALVAQHGIDGSEIDIYPSTKKIIYCFTLALGVIEYYKIPECLDRAIDSLILSSKIQSKIMTVVPKPTFDKIINAYFMGLEDYSTDQRGDVGSWVREACMNGFSEICPLIARLDLNNPSCEPWLSDELSTKIFAKLLKQSVERIDKIRSCAGRVLLEFLYMKILTGNEEVRYSSSTLLDYANELPVTSPEDSSLSLPELANELLNIFRHNEKQDRITIPLLEVLDLLFESGTLQKIDLDFF
ncbi:15997_t:CDS:10, partial [Racocetra fulgida]